MIEKPKFTIEVCDKDNVRTIIDGINRYNLDQVAAVSDVWTPLEFIAKSSEGIEIGGVLAGVGYWGGLEINILWVKEEYRNAGIGTLLLMHIEERAKALGATISMLDTFDFQAEDFYLKKGYTVVGEIKDFPKRHRRIYLSKKLADN